MSPNLIPLERMELSENTSAARVFVNRLMLSADWKLLADIEHRIIYVERLKPNRVDPRQPKRAVIPFERVDYYVQDEAAMMATMAERKTR